MTRLLIASDLHIKHTKQSMETIVAPVNRDVAIILGDFSKTHNTSKLEKFIRHNLQFSDIIYVLGNHEYCSPDFYNTPSAIDELFSTINKDTKYKAHLLHNKELIHSGIRFIGTTLWSNIDLGNPVVVDGMLRRTAKYGGITPEDILTEHRNCVKFVEDAINTLTDYTTIMLSHHAPSFKSISNRFFSKETNTMYATDLEYLMHLPHAPKYWMHGHIHGRSNYIVGNTNVLCNAHEYAKMEPNIGYDNSYILEVYNES